MNSLNRFRGFLLQLKERDINSSPQLERAGLVGTYFPEDSRVYLEEAVPRTKINLIKKQSSDCFFCFKSKMRYELENTIKKLEVTLLELNV